MGEGDSVTNPVEKFLGVPSKQEHLTPTERFRNESTYHGRRKVQPSEFNTGVTYHEQDQEDFDDPDNWAAAPVYDRPSE